MEPRRIIPKIEPLKNFSTCTPFPAPAAMPPHAPAKSSRPFEVSLIILPLLLFGFLLARFAAPLFRFLPACTFRQVTGVPCPSCGATRAGLALAQGDLMAALSFNPLFVLGLGILFGWSVNGVLARWRGKSISTGFMEKMMKPPGGHQGEAKFKLRQRLRWLVIGAIAGNWIYLILRAI
jgi:hypothetical protein